MTDQITSPEERARKKVFMVSGGAGRIICALPAFQKYFKNNRPEEFYIISQSGLEFFLGTEFQDFAFDPAHKGLFKDIIKDNDLINLEPYHTHGYYNQEKSLTEAFDKLVNETDDHKGLERPQIVLSQAEEINSVNTVKLAQKQQEKAHTIVIQPFGRNASQHDGGHVVDETSRSLSTDDYFYISEQLRKKYNVISMTEIRFDNDDNMYVDCNLRHWAGIIDAADYFVGIDSCGQHMAYAFNKPGSVIIGSTFAQNISYPDHFNILEKPNNYFSKQYSPIRIEGMDSELANRKNDTCMNFTEREIKDITNNILKDIEKRIGKTTYLDKENTGAIKPTIVPSSKKSKSKKSKKLFNEIKELPVVDLITPVPAAPPKTIDEVLEANNIKS